MPVQRQHFNRTYRTYPSKLYSTVNIILCLPFIRSFMLNGIYAPFYYFINAIHTALLHLSYHLLSPLPSTRCGMQQQQATCTWALASCAHVQVVLLLHPTPTCADGCWYPVPITFSNLRWWCFTFQLLAQTLNLHLWWLPSATCAGGLFPSSTCTYTACTYCNLHCVVVVVAVYMWLWQVHVVMMVVSTGGGGQFGRKPAFGGLSCCGLSEAMQRLQCLHSLLMFNSKTKVVVSLP